MPSNVLNSFFLYTSTAPVAFHEILLHSRPAISWWIPTYEIHIMELTGKCSISFAKCISGVIGEGTKHFYSWDWGFVWNIRERSFAKKKKIKKEGKINLSLVNSQMMDEPFQNSKSIIDDLTFHGTKFVIYNIFRWMKRN